MIIPRPGELPLGRVQRWPIFAPVNTLAASRGALRTILRRRHDRCAEHGSGMPHPTRIPQEAARHRDEVRIAGRDDCLRLRGRGDQPDRHRAVRRSRGGSRARTHLVPWPERNLLRGRHAAARRVDPVAAARDEPAREFDRLVERPARRRPSRCTTARTPSGRAAGHAARTASNTSSGNAMRLSNDPPYASVRHSRSATGIRAAGSRAPCAVRVRRCLRARRAARWPRTHRVSSRGPAHRARPAAARARACGNRRWRDGHPAAVVDPDAAARLPKARATSPCVRRARAASPPASAGIAARARSSVRVSASSHASS